MMDFGGDINGVTRAPPGLGDAWTIKPARSRYDMRPLYHLGRYEGSSKHIGSVNKSPSKLMGQWEKIEVTVDSSAVDTVGPSQVSPHTQVSPTGASKAGLKYVAANWSPIDNHGPKTLRGFTDY